MHVAELKNLPFCPPSSPYPGVSVENPNKAVDWATDNQGLKLFVVQREDHVKFGFGASGRAAR